jgi:hypothetical protein
MPQDTKKPLDYLKPIATLPPDENERQALKEKQDQVDALALQRTQAAPAGQQQQGEPRDWEKVQPLRPYGSKPGEVRYAVDNDGNIRPIPVPQQLPATHQVSTPATEQQPRLNPIIPDSLRRPQENTMAPVYDAGGDVSMAASNRAIESGNANLKSFLNAPSSAPAMQSSAPADASSNPNAGIGNIGNIVYGIQKDVAQHRLNKMDSSRFKKPSSMPGYVSSADSAAPAMPKIAIGKAPVFDDGGDVHVVKPSGLEKPKEESSVRILKPAGLEPIRSAESDVHILKPEGLEPDNSGVHVMKPAGLDKIAPVYDDGGQVNVNDGQHQLAVLKEGERVLTPDEAVVYKKEHPETEKGAPVDFPGRVLPNPKGLKPILDTDVKPKELKAAEPVAAEMHAELPTSKVTPEPKEEGAPADFPGRVIPNPQHLRPVLDTEIQGKADEPVGAKMSTDNGMGVESGATDFRESSLKPFDQIIQDRANAQVAKMTPVSATEQPKAEKETEQPKLTMGHILADKWLSRVMPPPPVAPEQQLGERKGPGLTPLALPPQGTTQNTALETPAQAGPPNLPEEKLQMPVYGGKSQKPVAQGEPIPEDDRYLHNAQRKVDVANLEKQRQEALRNGDLETADKLAVAKAEMEKTPWKDRSTLGKIGKVLSTAGNIAGDVMVPGIMAQVPGTELNKEAKEAEAQGRIPTEAEVNAKDAEAEIKRTPVGKTPPEQTFHDLMTGDNGNPRINPDTNAPYTAQEANVASQGTGKTPEELYIQERMRGIDPTSGKHFTRAQAEEAYLQMKAGNKAPNEEERRVKDYLDSRGLADTPVNREAARTALKASDTTATQQASLPFAEQKAKFNDSLATTRALLVQQNADANARGLKADELQNTENTRSAGVMTKLTTAKDALNATDEQFSNQIVPVVTLLSVTSAEGVKRVNKQELDKFVPASGSLGRWIEAHADQFLNGQIPDEYRTEVGHMLERMASAEETEHRINTESIDGTVRQGAQQPVQKPTGGAEAKPEKSKPQNIPTAANNKYHVAGAKGEIVSNDGKTWYTLDGKQVGK